MIMGKCAGKGKNQKPMDLKFRFLEMAFVKSWDFAN